MLSSKFDLRIIVSFLILFGVLGGYFLWQAFAYSYKDCSKNWLGAYEYSPTCVTESDEARVARLYFASFGRNPDKAGLEYWAKRLGATDNTKVTLEQVASNFVSSNEFKTKFGSLNNEQFVKQIYKQVFGRDADPGGLTYWKGRLDNKSSTRAQVVVSLSESNENKRNSINRVASALGIKFDKSKLRKINPGKIECLGTVSSYNGDNWCSVKLANPSPQAILKVSLTFRGSYQTIYNQYSTRLVGVDNSFVIGSTRQSNGSFLADAGFSTLYNYTSSLSSKSAPLNAYSMNFPEMSGYKLSTKVNDTSIGQYEVPKGTKSHFVTFHLKDADRAKVNALPANTKSNAEVSINMSSFATYVSETPRTQRSPQDQSRKTYYTSLSSTTSFVPSEKYINPSRRAAKYDVYVRGNKLSIPNSFPYLKSSVKAGNTDWQHTQTVDKGERKFEIVSSRWVNAPSRAYPFTTKFKIRMYKNGKYINPRYYKVQVYKCVSLVAGSTSNKFLTIKSSKGIYSMQSDYCAWDQIKASVKLNSKASLKVKLDIVGGPKDYRLFNSSIY